MRKETAVNPYRVPNADLEGEFKNSEGWSSSDLKIAKKYFRCTCLGGLTSGYVYLILTSVVDILFSGSQEDVIGDVFYLFIGYMLAFLACIPASIIYAEKQKKKYSVRRFSNKSQKELRSWYSKPIFFSVVLTMIVSFFIIFEEWFKSPSEFDLVLLSSGTKRWTFLAMLVFFPAVYLMLESTWKKAKKLIEQLL